MLQVDKGDCYGYVLCLVRRARYCITSVLFNITSQYYFYKWGETGKSQPGTFHILREDAQVGGHNHSLV